MHTSSPRLRCMEQSDSVLQKHRNPNFKPKLHFELNTYALLQYGSMALGDMVFAIFMLLVPFVLSVSTKKK